MSRLTRRVKELEKQASSEPDVCPACQGTGQIWGYVDVPPRAETYEKWLVECRESRERTPQEKTIAEWCAEVAKGNAEVEAQFLERGPVDEERPYEPPPGGCRTCGGTGQPSATSAVVLEETYAEWVGRYRRNQGILSHEEWCAAVAPEDPCLADALLHRTSDDLRLILLRS